MQHETSKTIFQLLDVMNSLLSRTYLVRNETLDLSSDKSVVTTQWVCYTRPETSFEAELVSHFPTGPLTVSLIDIIHTDHDVVLRRAIPKPTRNRYKSESKLEKERAKAKADFEHDKELVSALFGEEFFTKASKDALALWGHVIGEESLDAAVRSEAVGSLEPPLTITLQPRVGEVIPLGTTLVHATLASMGTIPNPRDHTPIGVDELFFQILSGLRAMLITLVDASGTLCHDTSGLRDADYIGNSSYRCAITAIKKMLKWSLEDFVPNAKYWKDYSLASCLSNPPPVVPDSWLKHGLLEGENLFSGQVGTFFRRLSQPLTGGKFDSDLFRANFTIAQSKRGFAPVPEVFVKKAFQKHASKLSTSSNPLSISEIDDLTSFLKTFFRHFQPTDLLGKVGRGEGSTSASNTSARSQGGAREHIRANILSAPSVNARQDLVRMVESSKGVVEERGYLPPLRHEWVEIIGREIDQEYHLLPDKTLSKIDESLKIHPFALTRAVLEPLKVRLITAMHALSSYVAKPLQKALWDYLAQFPCFELITKTFSPDVLHRMLSRHEGLFGKDSEWDFVSGDYSAATDNLKIEATKLVVDIILSKLKGLDVVLIPHVKNIILEQVLVYPQNMEIDPVLQKTGQLMGSILSFPILCILNLYTYVKALPDFTFKRIISGKLSIKTLPVLINGDDILFRAHPSMYDRWKSALGTVGFELSLGKNFVHPRFFTINSLPCEYVAGERYIPKVSKGTPLGMSWADLDEFKSTETNPIVFLGNRQAPNVFVHGFLNVGLLIGQSKTLSDFRGGDLPLNTWYDGAVLGSMYPTKMSNFFFFFHKEDIKSQTKFGSLTLNVFAHPYLGGLGFTVPPGVVPEYSEKQRALASHLLRAAELEYFGSPADHPLKPFAYLSDLRKTSSIGRRRGKVYTRLGSFLGPHLENEKVFQDTSLIHTTPLSLDFMALEDSFLTPMCRLSNSELGRLLRTANHQRQKLVPVTDMTSFPFTVITYTVEEPSTIPPEEEEAFVGSPTIKEDPSLNLEKEFWEYDTLPFIDQIRAGVALNRVSYRIAQEQRKERKSVLRLKKDEERRMKRNLQQ